MSRNGHADWRSDRNRRADSGVAPASDGNQFCAIGSAKSNIGHPDAAAGVIGLIKATLALHHKIIPASLHFTRPNPALGLESSPFFVNTETRPWQAGTIRAGPVLVRLDGGGTNAHCILEEAPEALASSTAGREEQVLLLSAHSAEALSALREATILRLEADHDLNFADAAWTSQAAGNPWHTG